MTQQIITSFPIYSSQQVQFKEKAKKISWALCRAKLLKSELSAFKRNDALARALGYKSHSDLVSKSKAKLQVDDGKPLIIFSNETVAKRIVTTFWLEFGGTDESHKLFQSVFEQLGDQEVDWEQGAARLSDDRHKLYIMISLNTDGIQFINITREYSLELDWKSSIKIGNTYGFSGRDDLIDLLKGYVDKPLLIEGIEEQDEHLSLTTLLKKLGEIPAPLLRSLYCEVEDQNREYINSLPQNKHLKSFF
jgi:hypothetical protein